MYVTYHIESRFDDLPAGRTGAERLGKLAREERGESGAPHGWARAETGPLPRGWSGVRGARRRQQRREEGWPWPTGALVRWRSGGARHSRAWGRADAAARAPPSRTPSAAAGGMVAAPQLLAASLSEASDRTSSAAAASGAAPPMTAAAGCCYARRKVSPGVGRVRALGRLRGVEGGSGIRHSLGHSLVARGKHLLC